MSAGQPRTIGKYEIVSTIGRGSMGVVYKAKDPEIGRLVAVKVLRTRSGATAFTTSGALDRFKIEARSAGNLRHPNIVTIFEVNTDTDPPYLVMDFIEGEVLESVLEREHRISPARLIPILEKVANALDFAHQRGVIHKDIKPSNIIIDGNGEAYILDFGVATVGEDEKSDLIMGTPGYMSPEQLLNQPLDARSDLFSLAVVGFEAFTGIRPYQGSNFNEVVGNILASHRTPLTTAAPELPLSLEIEFEKALSRDKEARFTSGRTMVESFAKALAMSLASKTDLIKVREKPDQFNSRGSKGESPEDMFKRAQSLKEERDRLFAERGVPSKSTDWLRVATLACGFFAIVFALILVAKIVRDSSGGMTPEEASQVTAAASGVYGKKEFDTLNYQVSTEKPPVGVPIAELSSPQLLGVLVSPTSSERDIIEALELGLQRRPSGFFEATLRPLFHESFVVRKEALRILSELKDLRGVEPCLTLLEDADPSVRKRAAMTLKSLGSSKAIAFLEARRAVESDSSVKEAMRDTIESITGLPASP